MRRSLFFRFFFYLFIRFQIHHLHVYFDMIPLPGIRGAFKNSATISSIYLSYAKLSAQTVCIDHIYINCWSPVYSWSVLEKQITRNPPPTNTRICVCVCVWGGGLVNCIYISVVRLWDFHNRSSKIIGQVISINHRL